MSDLESTLQHPGHPPDDPVDSAYAWWRLIVSLALSTIGGVGLWSVVVTLPTIEAEFGVDRGGIAPVSCDHDRLCDWRHRDGQGC